MLRFPTKDNIVAHDAAVAAEAARIKARAERYLDCTNPAELAAGAVEELCEMLEDGSLELRIRLPYDIATIRKWLDENQPANRRGFLGSWEYNRDLEDAVKAALKPILDTTWVQYVACVATPDQITISVLVFT